MMRPYLDAEVVGAHAEHGGVSVLVNAGNDTPLVFRCELADARRYPVGASVRLELRPAPRKASDWCGARADYVGDDEPEELPTGWHDLGDDVYACALRCRRALERDRRRA